MADVRGFLFEPVRPQDAGEIFALIEEVYRYSEFPIGHRWELSQVAEECEHGGLVLRDASQQIRAFVLYRDVGEAWEIGFLATRNNAKRQGLMRALLSKVIEVKPEGKSIWLEVHEENEPARRLYENLGFREVGRRRGYYADGGTAVLYNYG